MDKYVFVLAIIAIVMGAGLLRELFKRDQDIKASRVTGVQKRLTEVEDRLKVLEKIVTDKGTKLADEIDSL